MVFPVIDDQGKVNTESEEIITKIVGRYGQKCCLLYKSSTKKELFLEFRPTLKDIQVKADHDNIPLLLDEEDLKRRAQIGVPSKNIAPFELGMNAHITPFRPFQHIYGKNLLSLFLA